MTLHHESHHCHSLYPAFSSDIGTDVKLKATAALGMYKTSVSLKENWNYCSYIIISSHFFF